MKLARKGIHEKQLTATPNLPTPRVGDEPLSSKHKVLAPTVFTLFVMVFATSGYSQNATFTGDWVLKKDAQEQTQRFDAIERGIKDINGLIRGRARKMLREKTAPASNINITDKGERVTIARQKIKLTLPTDGSASRMQTENGTATVRAQRKNGALVVVSQTSKGVQTTTYRLSEDRKSLTLDVSISSEKMKTPIRFRATYQQRTRN